MSKTYLHDSISDPLNGDHRSREMFAASDPFARDLFGPGGPESGRGLFPVRQSHIPSVSAARRIRLPQITREQIRLSAALAAWPTEFHQVTTASIISVLALCSGESPENVSLTRIELREVDLKRPPLGSTDARRIYACLELEPRAGSVVIEMNAELGISLADLVLGGDGRRPDSLRTLSPAESALIEFLCLKSVEEINSRLGDPVLSLERVGMEAPAWLANQIQSVPACEQTEVCSTSLRGLLATFRLGIRDAVGIVRVWVKAGEAFSSLTSQDVAALFRGKGQNGPARHPDRKIAQYARIAPDIRMSIIVGETELTIGDLAQLEAGDLAIVKRPAVCFQEGVFSGVMRVRVGDGRQTLIIGQVERNARIGLQVETVLIGNELAIGKELEMQENQTHMSDDVLNGDVKAARDSTTDFAEALDHLLLTVHVEIGARQIKLDDLARLCVGQFLDLGCQVTDPVELLIDGRRIAQGELVDFEGRMGVLITQLAG